MCGICGIASRERVPSDVLPLMQDSLRHRGPDGAGDYQTPNFAMAVRRLSIIDLETGAQPLYNESRTLVLICNGEIYNFVELRAELESRGHSFSTRSDCETILHLYEEQGADCVHALRGMFAFALFDIPRRRLFLARDRLGEKPLYLYQTDQQLLFASELKTLLCSKRIPFELDLQAVDLYFHYQYVPEPRTAIKGIRKLPAAHRLMLDLNDWKLQEDCYWSMEDVPPIEGDAASQIRSQLETISSIVIRSDVPVGVALSGGLDSSAIAALAAGKYRGTLNAFSVGYQGKPLTDERDDARKLAEYLKIPFHEIELATQDLVEIFPELIYMRDDPIADIAGFGYYAISRLARARNVPVLLQGQGGDELFWGYDWVIHAARKSILKKNILGNHSGMTALINQSGGILSTIGQYRSLKLSRPDQFIFYDLVPEFHQAEKQMRSHYSKRFSDSLGKSSATEIFSRPQPWPPFPEVTITNLLFNTYLLENGVAQGDRLSMASSVELRLPLLDYRLVETVIGLRKHKSDLNLPPKAWFKEAIQDVLPEWVRNRPKRGFTPPVREWHSALFEVYGKDLESGYLVNADVLNAESARVLSKGAMSKKPVVPISYQALVLETWCRRMSRL